MPCYSERRYTVGLGSRPILGEGSGAPDLPRLSVQDNLDDDRFRVLGLKFAAFILANPPAFEDSARWLLALPGSRGTEPTSGTPPSEVGVYGPICLRLEEGWTYAMNRFPPGSDRFIDFGLDDAKRIAVLTALTFDKDFDGRQIGLEWTWDEPLAGVSVFDGRSIAWARLTNFPNPDLLAIVESASQLLRVKRSLLLAPPSPPHDAPIAGGLGEASIHPAGVQAKLQGESLDVAAAVLLRKNPTWTLARIARELNVRRQRLSDTKRVPTLKAVQMELRAEAAERAERLSRRNKERIDAVGSDEDLADM